ncbi:MAG: hypothetical protein LBQ88_08910 [Treponema sp.]|jgi:hypothetical protein|nr:hypothetical protein [Treponema sp.]
MKARKLRELLGDPGYIISQGEDDIRIGSVYCTDLISVNKKTLKVKYALDTSHEGRKSLRSEVLQSIWDTLHRLIETGKIREIIGGKDIIENPFPVFTARYGKLVESVTDKYGWPNVDDDGILMYDNTHFPTKKAALKRGIEELSARIISYNRMIGEYRDKLKETIRGRQESGIKRKELRDRMKHLSDQDRRCPFPEMDNQQCHNFNGGECINGIECPKIRTEE